MSNDIKEQIPAELNDDELSQVAGGLSGGQRQRVSIARAIWANAPMVIADGMAGFNESISEDVK